MARASRDEYPNVSGRKTAATATGFFAGPFVGMVLGAIIGAATLGLIALGISGGIGSVGTDIYQAFGGEIAKDSKSLELVGHGVSALAKIAAVVGAFAGGIAGLVMGPFAGAAYAHGRASNKLEHEIAEYKELQHARAQVKSQEAELNQAFTNMSPAAQTRSATPGWYAAAPIYIAANQNECPACKVNAMNYLGTGQAQQQHIA